MLPLAGKVLNNDEFNTGSNYEGSHWPSTLTLAHKSQILQFHWCFISIVFIHPAVHFHCTLS